MSQVHKEQLTEIENALPNRSGLDVEIFGMEGVPDDVIKSHNQRVATQFQQAEAERQAATGNPPPGSGAGGQPAKKPKLENATSLKERLAQHRKKKAEEAAAGGSSGDATPVGAGQSAPTPTTYVSSFCFMLVARRDTDIHCLGPTASRAHTHAVATAISIPTAIWRRRSRCPLSTDRQSGLPDLFACQWTTDSRCDTVCPTRILTSTIPGSAYSPWLRSHSSSLPSATTDSYRLQYPSTTRQPARTGRSSTAPGIRGTCDQCTANATAAPGWPANRTGTRPCQWRGNPRPLPDIFVC